MPHIQLNLCVATVRVFYCTEVAELKLQFLFCYPVRSAFELWGHGRTHSELRTSLLNYPSENMVMLRPLVLFMFDKPISIVTQYKLIC